MTQFPCLTPAELSSRLGVSKSQLCRLRESNRGPSFFRDHRGDIHYPLPAVQAYELAVQGL